MQYDDDADYDDDEDSIGREDDGNEDVLDEQVGSCCPWPWAQLGAAHLLSHAHRHQQHQQLDHHHYITTLFIVSVFITAIIT